MYKPPQEIDIGDYIVQKPQFLGKGQYGVVYKCKSKIENPVSLCVKVYQYSIEVLHQKEIEQKLIKREIEILKSLQEVQNDNDHLVRVFDVIDKDNTLYIIMEYCEESDLKGLMDQHKKAKTWFKVEDAINIVAQVVSGYSMLYKKRIIHRDLKPANILIAKKDGKRIYKLADLGMGRIIEDMNFANNFTKVGTPAYAAPQLYLDYRFSSKADVYSLGVIFYQLIYKTLPIEAKTQAELIEQMRNMEEFPFKCPEESDQKEIVSEEVRSLIETMLRYRESDRHSWMDLFRHKIFKLEILTPNDNRLTRKLTLSTQTETNNRAQYLVDEIHGDKIIQLLRILAIKNDIAMEVYKQFESFKTHLKQNTQLNVRQQQISILSVCLTGYKYKLVLSTMSLAMNRQDLVSNALAIQLVDYRRDLQEFYQRDSQIEEIKQLKDHIRKQLNPAILQFREDECRFLNICRNNESADVESLRTLIELDDNHDFLCFAQLFDEFLTKFQLFELFTQEQLAIFSKFCKSETTLDVKTYLQTKPLEMLRSFQPE